MRIDERVRARVMTLIARGDQLAAMTPQWKDRDGAAIIHEREGWFASSMNIIELVFPDPLCAHRTRAQSAMFKSSTSEQVGALAAIMKAALVDIDAGVVASITDVARGEVFGHLLDHAQHYLKGRRPDVAAVIAGVAFEDTLRRACDKLSIPQVGVELEQLIIALVKRDVITDIKAQRARAAAGLRTKATHAQWTEFAIDDVEATIKTTRDFIDLLDR